ncbi:MAG TPA: thioredoxin family protein [Flavisolibacter sp.]|nr:thioredoxin family protein [Flavisolibacter sp.]
MKMYFLVLIVCLVSMIKASAQDAPSADAVLTEALSRAAKENKKVMVVFHASWCGWCRKMEISLNDPSVTDFFEKNYVIVYLTMQESKDKKNLENSGAEKLNRKWGGENQGVPFWIIMDKNGSILANSQIQPGKNIGCPATVEEVAYFINVLKKTSSITNEEIATIEARFRRNE